MPRLVHCYHPTVKPPENGTELFVAINGYMDYMVSNKGRVKNAHSHDMIEPKTSKNGHMCVSLIKNENNRSHRVHDLVARAFAKLPPGNLRRWRVEHMDGDVINNNARNLSWVPIPGSGASVDDWKEVEWVPQHSIEMFEELIRNDPHVWAD